MALTATLLAYLAIFTTPACAPGEFEASSSDVRHKPRRPRGGGTCTPISTCGTRECGTASDSCGGVITCGSCADDETCSSEGWCEWAGEDPVDPGDGDPVDPGDGDPVDPGDGDPVDPGDGDPVDPGDDDPPVDNPPPGGVPVAGTATLFFSDLDSGPSTGWQGSNERGAAVTIWGRNFGAATGSVTVGGAAVAGDAILEWGVQDAVPGMQRITFLVPSTAAAGLSEILVTVDGETSNALPFTVRAGVLRYVTVGGDDDSGDGTWARPFRTLVRAVDSAQPGDIVYAGDGVSQTDESDYGAALNMKRSGEPGRPIAIVAMPGATVRVGAVDVGRAMHNWESDGEGGYTGHWTIAKLQIVGGTECVPIHDGSRLVGNRITAPEGDGMNGCVAVDGDGARVLGNEFYEVGTADCSKLYHVLYGSGVRRDDSPRAATESDREFAWNYFHDNLANRAINVYSEQDYAAFITDHRVHDNLIVNQRGDGIMLGYYVTGDNWIYNNVVVDSGLGPDWSDDSSSHAGIRLNAGHEDVAGTTIHVYNNTLVRNGWAGAEWGTGNLYLEPEAMTRMEVVFTNNILVAGEAPNIASDSGSPSDGPYTNLYSGGVADWDTAAISDDPLFVDEAALDFRLADGSAAIDSGLATGLSGAAADFDGVSRPQGDGVDLGAYER